MSPYTMPRIVADIRKRLAQHPDAPKLMHRLGVIAQDNQLVFRINATTAGAFLDGDLVAEATITGRVDKVADRYQCDVSAVSVDGTLLYRRMTK